MKKLELLYLLEKRIKKIRSGCERVFDEFPKEWGDREIGILLKIMTDNPAWNTKRVIAEIKRIVDKPVNKNCQACGSFCFCLEEDPNIDISRGLTCVGWIKIGHVAREPRVKFGEEGMDDGSINITSKLQG